MLRIYLVGCHSVFLHLKLPFGIHHQWEMSLAYTSVTTDDEGVTLVIDRFDPGREVTGSLRKVPTAFLPGDSLIPCSIDVQGPSSGDLIIHTAEDFSLAFKGLQYHLCSKEALDPSKLIIIRTHIAYAENMDNLNFEFHWAAVTLVNMFECTPIKPVPIIPTALARNLRSHINIAQIQGVPKCGYLTMDQTRKLLLVLESDPKAYTLPLVGIWLSGITHIHSPHVWACCLRYMFSSSVEERVLSESGHFLIVLYSLTHKEPEFYECLPCSGYKELDIQLLTGNEAIRLFQNVEPSDRQPILFELSAELHNAEMGFFNEVSKNASVRTVHQGSSPNTLSVSDHDSGVEDEDFSPRPTPSPHPSTQQISRIQPSVPELSFICDGSFESKTVPQHIETINSKIPLTLVPQSGRNTNASRNLSNQNQHGDHEPQGRSNTVTTSNKKGLSNSLNPKISAMKPFRETQSPLHAPNPRWKVGPQVRKNCSSSSSSTPQSGSSPDTSVHQPRLSSERLGSNHVIAIQRKVPPPVRRSSISNSKLPAVAPQSHPQGITLQLQNPRTEMEVSVPHIPTCHPPHVCGCSQNHGHIQYSATNAWQGIRKMGSPNIPERHSEVSSDNAYSAFQQNLACPNMCCNQVCSTSSPINQGCHGRIETCSPPSGSLSPGSRLPSQVSPCNLQSYAAYPACTHTPTSIGGLDNGMMGLSADAYRLLVEQDRQLKILQSQIQRLLEAQTLQPASTKMTTSSTQQSPRQVEFVAMQTQSAPGLQMRKSMSIAVSTGASLFWNSPCTSQEESPVKPDDADISEDITVSVHAEDTSHTSIASSLKAVDIHSFESSHVTETEENGSPDPLNQYRNGPELNPGSPSARESTGTNLQDGPVEGANCSNTADCENKLVHSDSVQSDDHKLYKDLLGQVNQLLKTSFTEAEESSAKESIPAEKCVTSESNIKKKNPVTYNDKDDVLSATLKQLRNLGVKIDLDSPNTMRSNANKVENASVLACINPDAVLPRLSYMSFANIGMSGFNPSGADLSMEANAIALKYLDESQLSQLSQSRSRQNNALDSSAVQGLLHLNADKSLVGLSLISPNNMSFATRKYMKRYGLIQSNDGSEDEVEDEVFKDSSVPGEVENGHLMHQNFRPVIMGLSYRKEQVSERLNTDLKHNLEIAGSLLKPGGNTLRDITNERISPKPSKLLQPPEENSLQVLKDFKPSAKFLTGNAQFTKHPEKENAKDVQILPDKLPPSPFETLKFTENQNSVGDFLDVNRLRQLPKLF
ncbi:SCL-interrupting locus protein isoform X2 [Microcaecilia unicolor]|uniref:SCL-interrupting locus protein isoform X2 n=1 Tax=Microcaecilia unicolor TaxID=1415580 RepID=A0A6P7Y4G7_9AMPH|nr:SCL-interrupting locus protein isoform X2 [Microcaecilia unicolor]